MYNVKISHNLKFLISLKIEKIFKCVHYQEVSVH